MKASGIIFGIMYLASLLPDWNALDSVRIAHSRLELWSIISFGLLAFAEAIAHRTKDAAMKDRIDAIGIAFFVLAVAFEGGAYAYGIRNDDLSEKAIRSLNTLATDASVKSKTALYDARNAGTKADAASLEAGMVDRKAGAIDKRLNKASLQLEVTEEMVLRTGPRETLIKQNRELIGKALKPFVGQKFVVMRCGQATKEIEDFADQLDVMFIHAKWDGYSYPIPCPDEQGGVLLTTSPTSKAAMKVRDALLHLFLSININALEDGIAIDGQTGLPTIIETDPAQRILKSDPSVLVIRVGYNPMYSNNTKVIAHPK